jgi:hypothetical protein
VPINDRAVAAVVPLKAILSAGRRSSVARAPLRSYRRPPQIVAVELQQVEGAEDGVVTAGWLAFLRTRTIPNFAAKPRAAGL